MAYGGPAEALQASRNAELLRLIKEVRSVLDAAMRPVEYSLAEWQDLVARVDEEIELLGGDA